jgi:hypothetical protein
VTVAIVVETVAYLGRRRPARHAGQRAPDTLVDAAHTLPRHAGPARTSAELLVDRIVAVVITSVADLGQLGMHVRVQVVAVAAGHPRHYAVDTKTRATGRRRSLVVVRTPDADPAVVVDVAVEARHPRDGAGRAILIDAHPITDLSSTGVDVPIRVVAVEWHAAAFGRRVAVAVSIGACGVQREFAFVPRRVVEWRLGLRRHRAVRQRQVRACVPFAPCDAERRQHQSQPHEDPA